MTKIRPVDLMACLVKRFLSTSTNLFNGKYFLMACWAKVVLIIKIYYMISRSRPADKLARLENRFFVDIDNSLLVNTLLGHVQQKLFSLLTSITRCQEWGPRTSWLAWRVDFFYINNSLMVNILFRHVEY